MSDLQPPESIGGFRVEQKLGEGGMGEVYRCHDHGLQRDVAIKVLRRELMGQETVGERFLREARAMARVSSPHVVAVHQVGTDDAGPFLVMEYLQGEDLGKRLRRIGSLPVAEAVGCLIDATIGLQTAHEAGLVHRDVKPENLFLLDGHVKLTDFGLARPIDGSGDLTSAGLVVGTPHYLAPEIARGQEATAQSDIYALGATLFELITGRPPYGGSTSVEIVSAHITQAVPDLSAFGSKHGPIPANLVELCRRMLAKDPAERPTGYESLRKELEAIQTELGGRDLKATEPDAVSQTPGTEVMGSQSKPGMMGGGRLTAEERSSNPTPQTGSMPVSASRSGTTTGTQSRAGMQSTTGLQVKTDTLAVMFTDIAGYTERTGLQSREEAAYWLELHDQLLKPIFRSFGGTVVKTIGDAFLVTFKSPTDAVHCGCAIQDRLWEHNGEAAPAERIEVRVAISLGEVRLRRGDVLGEPVNLAARLEKLADAGDVVFSDAVRATMTAAEVAATDLGENTFKGIQRAVRVYRATKDEAHTATLTEGSPAIGPPFGGRALAQVKDETFGLDAARTRRLAQRAAVVGLVVVTAAIALWWWIDVASAAADVVASSDDDPEPEAAQEPEAAAEPDDTASDDSKADGQGTKLKTKKPDDGADEDITKWTVAELGKFLDDEVDTSDIRAELHKRDEDELVVGMENVLEKGNWLARKNALSVLEKKGVATDKHRQMRAVRDLLKSSKCSSRKKALRTLTKVAVDDDALDALDEVRQGGERNACMRGQFESAEEKIRARID